MKPQIVIFSSSAALPIAEGLHSQIEARFDCHLWKGEFFGENKTTPLWTFFKKLFNYDYVILVLSDDNMVLATDGRETGMLVPKDNVIFELGACMARLGPQKTIMVTPDQPVVHLPTYFDDVEPLIYHYENIGPQNKDDAIKATKTAAENILSLLNSLTAGSFHAELPAQGLAYAYHFNFLKPVLNSTKAQQFGKPGSKFNWVPQDGLHIIIAVPEEIMNWEEAGRFFSTKYPEKISKHGFLTNDGRDMGVYMVNLTGDHQLLEIIDIPTTLLTTRNVINKVETFWREKDHIKVTETDFEFIKALEAREILNFERVMEDIKKELGESVSIIPLSQLDSFLALH